MKKIIQSVPNFSEGEDHKKIENIVACFRAKQGLKLIDYQTDKNHNRMVVTIIGDPASIHKTIVESVGVAIDLIDMTQHKGEHPRMGAVDVIPFIPIKNISMQEAIEISQNVAKEIAQKYNLPIFLYEASALKQERKNLASIRKGEFEQMGEKLKSPDWKPDFGPDLIHPTAGVTAVGVRMPLIAFNVNLNTDNIEIANNIAKKVRHISGGLKFCKAIGVELKEQGMVQVSMNMTDYKKTALYTVFELIKIEAKRYGVSVRGSEIVGLSPMEAMIDTAAYYLGLENFTIDQVVETHTE